MPELRIPTDWQRTMIERVASVAAADDRILAVWLGGSFGSGHQDEFSDVDIHCLVTEESRGWFAEHWRETASAIADAPLALATDIRGVIGGYTLTDAFRHLDLIIHPVDPGCDLDPQQVFAGHPAHVLHDPAVLLPPVSPLSPTALEPYFPAESVTFFFYMLHAFSVSVQRRELVLAQFGVYVVRDFLQVIMLAENGAQRGGAKRLNGYLTDEQRTTLENVRGPGTDLAEVINTVAAISRETIRRVRRLAERTSETWPVDLEAVAVTYLQKTLGVDFGPLPGT